MRDRYIRLVAIAGSAAVLVSSTTALQAQAATGCAGVVDLQAQRATALTQLVSDLTVQLDAAPDSEKQAIEQRIRFVETRQHLLDVAFQRLNGPKLNDKKCEAIEAFILRHSSIS